MQHQDSTEKKQMRMVLHQYLPQSNLDKVKAYETASMKSIKSGACVLGDTGDTENEQYLKEPLIPFHRANSYLWWRENWHRFVQL